MVEITKLRINKKHIEKEYINEPRQEIVGMQCELYKKVAELKNFIYTNSDKKDYHNKTIFINDIKDDEMISYRELEIHSVSVYKNADEEILLNFTGKYTYEGEMFSGEIKHIEERSLNMETMKEICDIKEFLDMAEFIIKNIEEQINKMKKLGMI